MGLKPALGVSKGTLWVTRGAGSGRLRTQTDLAMRGRKSSQVGETQSLEVEEKKELLFMGLCSQSPKAGLQESLC